MYPMKREAAIAFGATIIFVGIMYILAISLNICEVAGDRSKNTQDLSSDNYPGYSKTRYIVRQDKLLEGNEELNCAICVQALSEDKESFYCTSHVFHKVSLND